MIESNYFWMIIFFLGLGTLAIRYSIIGVSGRLKISERTQEIFSYIPAAVLPALIAPAVFFHNGQVAWAFQKERLLILILATVVCYFSKSTLATICFGLITLYLLTQTL